MTTLLIPDPALLLAATLRIVAALMVMPIYGHRSMPSTVRVVLAGAMAWLLVSAGSIQATPPDDFLAFLLGLGGETLLGLLLGFCASLVFWALTMAGELVGLQMGWNFGSTLHMSFENSSAPTGQFYTIMGSLIFLTMGGHRLALLALQSTFQAMPPFGLALNSLRPDYVITLGSTFFAGAFQLALPVLGTLILTDVTLGFLNRVLPQLNTFLFGLPLKIVAGLLALWISLPALILLMQNWLGKAIFGLQGMAR